MSHTPVTLCYGDLVTRPDSLASAIEEAFGNKAHCLGLLVIKDLPPVYQEKRKRLLKLAERFGALPEDQKEKYVDKASNYSFGWSQGKEIMNGKPDTKKGSYYANPIVDEPDVSQELKDQFPEYYRKNIWPSKQEPGVTDFEEAFKDLGRFIFKIGCELASACQKFASTHLTDQSVSFEKLLSTSQTTKARLLHYYPHTRPLDGEKSEWCGTHLDNSMLTGLCSALYLKQSIGNGLPVEVPEPTPDAGLYIYTRGGEVTKAVIPDDALAFQTGEALELCTGGRLRATPHLVTGGSWTEAAENVSRETFVVFMQPDTSQMLSDRETFGSFSKRIFAKHYDTV